MTTSSDFPQIAEQMLHDYDGHTPGTTFADGFRLSISDAYRLQAQVAHLRERRGEHLAGYKIGCVCRGNQEKNGLTHPVYGRLWSTEQHATNVSLAMNEFAHLAIEGEVAVSLHHDVEPRRSSIQEIAEAVDEVYTVIELHNLVLHSDHPTGAELIANNAIHAGVVYSNGTKPPKTGDCTEMTVALDGDIAEHWVDRRWPDDVLMAVPWLVTELAKEGRHLKAGQKILTGAWGPPLPLHRSNSAETSALLLRWDSLDGTEQSNDKQMVTRVKAVSTLFVSAAASFSSLK